MNHLLASVGAALTLLVLFGAGIAGASADDEARGGRASFILDDGTDLRKLADPATRMLLQSVTGQGATFGTQQRTRYCALTRKRNDVQWVVNNLETGAVIARSANAEKLFFGASTSKLFVAAALLDVQNGALSRQQLSQLVRMVVVSSNEAWHDLQRQVGGGDSEDVGRAAVHAFAQRMGYERIRAFQGWMKRPDGSRVHGNELNALELSRFLFDTYQRRYSGADILWRVMHATRTGNTKIDKYAPPDVSIGGKTGTYSGPNASPDTVALPTIRARNHAAVLTIGDALYGISILANTGKNEDVAVLGGGLMREYLGVSPRITCPQLSQN